MLAGQSLQCTCSLQAAHGEEAHNVELALRNPARSRTPCASRTALRHLEDGTALAEQGSAVRDMQEHEDGHQVIEPIPHVCLLDGGAALSGVTPNT